MKKLVRLRTRPSRDGRSFTYYIDYTDEDGKRRRISLGHADRKKAAKQRVQKERELRMGIVEPAMASCFVKSNSIKEIVRQQ